MHTPRFKFTALYRACVDNFEADPRGKLEFVYFSAVTPEHALAQVREMFPAGQLRSLMLQDGELALRVESNG